MHSQFPRFLRPLFGQNLIWNIKTSSKIIYLTFDDGPVPQTTPKLLELLDHYGVKATFFCVGENVQRHPELFEAIKQRGHQVGNHTFNHLKGFSTDNKMYVENVQKADALIHSRLFRPPYGQIKFSQRKLLKSDYQIVMWDFITYDYAHNITPEEILPNIKRRVRAGSIVVFHDSIHAASNMFTALPAAIEFWTNAGYKFEKL